MFAIFAIPFKSIDSNTVKSVTAPLETATIPGMVAVSSGAVTDFTVLESIDLNGIAKIAKKMVGGYKEPGK